MSYLYLTDTCLLTTHLMLPLLKCKSSKKIWLSYLRQPNLCTNEVTTRQTASTQWKQPQWPLQAKQPHSTGSGTWCNTGNLDTFQQRWTKICDIMCFVIFCSMFFSIQDNWRCWTISEIAMHLTGNFIDCKSQVSADMVRVLIKVQHNSRI